MERPANGRVTLGRGVLALGVANARYWLTVAPRVRGELRRWRVRADAIADPVLRAHALGKLADAGAHAQVIATLATLAPPRERERVVVATVAFEVLYDYLDAVSEQPVADPLGNGRQLYRAFDAALARDASASDCYRRHPQRDDGGYVEALAAACREALHALPGAAAVVPVARRTAARCGEAQTRSHAVAGEGEAQLERWARDLTAWSGLTWPEVAAGAAASVLGVHALIAAAADPLTTRAEALRIDAAYLPICALATLLDSLVDRARDAASGSHAYISYYADDAVAAERMRVLARRAIDGAATLRHASHHAMSVSGTVAYYLSAPEARRGAARAATRSLTQELRPLILPILLLFRCWRLAVELCERGAPGRPARMSQVRCAVIRRWLSALVPLR
jgi:tetraprenyl-beta-curcumene synthase